MARADLSGIKSAVQTILETANIVGGNPIDLSDTMTDRVKKVLQVNMEKIPIQPSFFPCITMFIDNKEVSLLDLAGSMLTARRRGEIDLKIVGVVWIDNMNTSNFEYKDLADNECEKLMENIEQVLRVDPTLAGKALWSKTTSVAYGNYPVSEQTHMRAGLMTYKIMVQY